MRNDNHNCVCSNCGAKASYDGRCGDGPYLTCRCVSEENSMWIDDGRGGYPIYRNDARPIPVSESRHWGRNIPGPSGLS